METTPLLGRKDRFGTKEFIEEAKPLCTVIFNTAMLALPVVVYYLLNFTLNFSSVISLGHLGKQELAASALATMFCNVTGFSLGQGLGTALDTLCSQAFTGSSDRHALGKHLQRSFVIMLFLSIPIGILWYNASAVLLLLGQNAAICELCQIITRWMFPGLVAFLIGDCLKRYLQSQGIARPSMYITMAVLPVNIALQWLFVWSEYSIGVKGAPIASSISNILITVALAIYIAYSKSGSYWGGWDAKEAFNISKIRVFLSLGIPGVIMTCAEWWAFEIVALAAGMLGDDYLAVQSVIINTTALTYMFPLGLSVATTIRVGNSLGAGDAIQSKNIAITSICLALLLASINSTALISFRNVWGYIFSQDPKIVQMVADVLPIAAIYQFGDAVNSAIGGVLRGCGRQKVGAKLNLVGYYLIGLPVALLLAFKLNLGLGGLWAGLATTIFLLSISLCTVVYCTNWDRQVQKAYIRINGSEPDEQ